MFGVILFEELRCGTASGVGVVLADGSESLARASDLAALFFAAASARLDRVDDVLPNPPAPYTEVGLDSFDEGGGIARLSASSIAFRGLGSSTLGSSCMAPSAASRIDSRSSPDALREKVGRRLRRLVALPLSFEGSRLELRMEGCRECY